VGARSGAEEVYGSDEVDEEQAGTR
jgi:hypothetical protein